MNGLDHKIFNHFERAWAPAVKNRNGAGEVSFEDAIHAMQENSVLAPWIEYTFLMVVSSYRLLTNYQDHYTPTTVFHSPSEKDFLEIFDFFNNDEKNLEGLSLGSLSKYGFPDGDNAEDVFLGYPKSATFLEFFLKYKEIFVRNPGYLTHSGKGNDFRIMRRVALQKILDASRTRRSKSEADRLAESQSS